MASLPTPGKRGLTLFHGSPRSDMTAADVRIIGGEGRKQGKAGRSYGGFYAADEASVSDAEGYAGADGTVYRIELVEGAVVEEKAGDITRLSEQTIAEYRERGVDVVKGKDPRGRTEYAIVNGAAIASMADRNAAPAPSPLAADWEAVKAWFKREGVEVSDDGEIPTEAHEIWARGMERYFMEGKSPSSALEGAFSSFRAWLLRIYQLVTRLNVNLTPEVRGVMDRMVATDNAIAWALHEGESRLLFDAAAATKMGMTGAEYNAYAQLLDDNRTEAFNALLYRTMERIRRSRTAEYREEEARVRVDVAEEVNARPEVRALHMLRGANGEQYRALDRESVMEIVGKEGIRLIPSGRAGAPSVRAGGVHPDLMAELAGFRDGRELLDALIGIEARRKELVAANDKRGPIEEAIDIETDRVMADRHPDAFDDGSIEAEALDVIHNDKGAEILAAEVRQLARAVGDAPTPLDVVRGWAERTVREGRIVDQASGQAVARHQRSEQQAARAAERAYLAGDMKEAFRQKQKQMVANALFRAASNAKASVDVMARRMDRYARSRGTKGLDPEYLDRIHELLERYDLRKRPESDIRERESFERWAKAQ